MIDITDYGEKLHINEAVSFCIHSAMTTVIKYGENLHNLTC